MPKDEFKEGLKSSVTLLIDTIDGVGEIVAERDFKNLDAHSQETTLPPVLPQDLIYIYIYIFKLRVNFYFEGSEVALAYALEYIRDRFYLAAERRVVELCEV